MAKIIIPTPLRKFTQNQASFEAQGQTIQAAFEELGTEFPDIKQHLLDEEGNLRQFINVYVGDEDIASLNQAQTAIDGQTVVSIIPAIAGGLS